MNNRRTVVFAGHFTVGTVISPAERQTVAEAAAFDGDRAVLVNDMGVFRRAVLYATYGQTAVVREVRRAPRCGSVTSCPSDVAQLDRTIDWATYASVQERLAGCDSAPARHAVLHDVVRDLVARRLAAHGLEPSRVRVFYERQLRNAASSRLRNRTVGGAASWQSALAAAGVLGDVLVRLSRIPTCGAILLALYERLTREGYARVLQFYDESDRGAIENGVRLYRILSAAKGWPPLELESRFCAAGDSAPAEAAAQAR